MGQLPHLAVLETSVWSCRTKFYVLVKKGWATCQPAGGDGGGGGKGNRQQKESFVESDRSVLL